MMAVGKSTIGRLLSKKLGMEFADLDNTIERRESLTIKEIFDRKGEAYFRKIEENEGLNIIKNGAKIIALGGGTFINDKVREEVKKTCFSVWLDLSSTEIFKRVEKSKSRPLLLKAKSVGDIENIYSSRKKIYSLANYRIDCASKNTESIVNEIIEIYENI